ncbi:MAG: hypothetical protein PF795_02450 [Kiritimatiellae bacterium]|jgi:predicted deacylase|nr:hypothetical protein [Kiritimatiellia bacterium]
MNNHVEIKPIQMFATEGQYVETRRKLNELVEQGSLVNLGRIKRDSPDLCMAFKQTTTGEVWLLTAPDQASRGSFLKIEETP